ncbi:Ubiquitin carboxyl-terminal hydrolase 10 [Elasticomyces elasticus]|nr:Ubiquitin carboxyl-terminal hydrolase 10 [Elasticomyces elasticus]
MAKRHAEELLEHVVAADSPASKRARLEEVQRSAPTNGFTNGHDATADGSDASTPDVLAAADARHEELEEAGALDEDVADDSQPAIAAPTRQTAPTEGYDDLYLDTIDRSLLDFDFEKLCSVTLSNINVYACLICGKYYQGRGPKSQAYFHALEERHHVYINMGTKKVYVLPEGYEVKSSSLDDIKFVVDPQFSKDEVAQLDKRRVVAYDLQNKPYNPGFVGMNNIKANDYFNVISQALAHVPPLRNYFMLEDLSTRPQLAQRFSILLRKLWNPRAFKSHVSPHELLQEIALRSSKRYNLTTQSDPVEFLSWFLNNLHLALGGSKTKPRSSIIQHIFQGHLRIESQAITARADAGDRLRFEDAAIQTTITPFLVLTLDLPPAPLFQDERESHVIPQVPLTAVLQKYDGVRAHEQLSKRVRYRLLHPLPPCLLMHIKRFEPNKFLQSQRNPTIVTFSPRALDMSPYVQPDSQHPPSEPIWYDLVANVTHEAVRVRDDSVEGEAERKVWRCQVLDRRESGASGGDRDKDRWWEMQDLYVSESEAETLHTKESYLMVWERRKTPGKGKSKAMAR